MAPDAGSGNGNGGVVLNSLQALDQKLQNIIREQADASERIRDVQHSQVAIHDSIKRIGAAIAATDAQVRDVARTAQQLRADFEALRDTLRAQLGTLENVTSRTLDNVVKILAIVERQELERRRQLELRNIVRNAADLLNALSDPVVRYIFAKGVQELFEQRQLVTTSFTETPDRQYFDQVCMSMGDAVAAISDVDRREIQRFTDAMAARWQNWLDTLDNKEHDAQTLNATDKRNADAEREQAAEIRRTAASREEGARRTARAAFAVAALCFAVGLLNTYYEGAPALAVWLVIVLIALVIGLRKYHYTASADAEVHVRRAIEYESQIRAREGEVRELDDRIRATLGAEAPHTEDGVAALRAVILSKRDEDSRIRDEFLTKHPELRGNA